MKNILIVMNTMGRAGAERALISMLRSFDYSKCRVSLLSIVGRGELFEEVPAEVTVLNQNPSFESVTSKAGRSAIARDAMRRLLRGGYIFKFLPYAIRNLFYQLRTGRLQPDKLLWRALADTTPPREESYDLAIAYIEGGATYYVAKHVKAAHKVSFVHVNYEMAGYHKALDKDCYEEMEYVFCVSEALKQAFEAVYPELAHRVRLFYNIILIEDIFTQAALPGGFTDDFDGIRILTVGRLHPQKGLDVAIAALARLVELGYDKVRWYVLGEGVQREKLEELIEKHGLQDRFFLLGAVSNPYPYLKQCDLYSQPSRFEGMGIALLEALLLGRPSVTTDFDGIPSLLDHGENALIITLSEENLVAATRELLDDAEKRTRIGAAASTFRYEYSGDVRVLYDVADGKPI